MLCACTDLYIRITDDVSLITATIDIANGTNGKDCIIFLTDLFYSIFIGSIYIITTILVNVLISRSFFQRFRHFDFALLHIHIDMWVAYDSCLVTTTVDGTDARGRDDIEMRLLTRRGQCPLITLLQRRTVRLIAIDGVRSQIATEIQFSDLDRHTALLLDVHSDRAIDLSAGIVTAEHLIIFTVGDVQHDVTVHVGILRTAEDGGHIRCTTQIQNDLTVDQRVLTTAVGLSHIQVAGATFLILRPGHGADITLLVTTAVGSMDGTTKDFDMGNTRTVHIAVCCCLSSFLGLGIIILNAIVRFSLCTVSSTIKMCIVLVTHIGTRIVIVLTVNDVVILTITTAEQFLNLIDTIHTDVGSRSWCSITATIHLLDARQITAIDIHF